MSGGMKFDGEKIKTELLYQDFVNELEEVASVLTFGANKYAARSWKTVPNGFERYYAALIRHTNARIKGEMIDPESGKSHLSHAACCLLFMMGLDSTKEDSQPVDVAEAIGMHPLMAGNIPTSYDEGIRVGDKVRAISDCNVMGFREGDIGTVDSIDSSGELRVSYANVREGHPLLTLRKEVTKI